jgi:purine-cytosine permease-like protein
MVVSRATFGLIGNVVPALLAVVTRLFWGAVLLWLLASSVAVLLVGAGVNGAVGERQLLLISLAGGFLIALLVAFAGYPLFARIQLILSVISGALVIGLIALTWRYVNIGTALTTQDGPWILTISGAVLVFSFVGMVWATGGADLARYQRVGSSGASSMLWATFGTTLPTLVLICYGALLAASDPGIASGFLLSPLDTLARMLPGWYPIPLLAATALSLLSGVVLSLYSGGFALQAVGLRVQRQWSIVILALPLGVIALVLTFGLTGGITQLFRDAATTLAVPTAAWVGIFGAETMIRNRRYASGSLLRRGGIYPAVRWVNLLGLLVATVIGFGLTTATVSWLNWQGFLLGVLKIAPDSALAASDVGVLVALGIGLLIPVVAGIPAIRRQESSEVSSEQAQP